MITGVETAGLALAALPLVISALEHYNEGLKPFKDFFRYKALIKELVNGLKLQEILLRNTCEQLLTGVVDSDVELADLLHDPTSSAWSRDILVSSLRERLQHSFDIFVTLVSGLRATLDMLTARIGLDAQGQPRWIDAKSHKQYWKRFSICLSRKEHEALLARMAKDNQNLKHLVTDSLQLEPVRSRRQKRKYKLWGIRTRIGKKTPDVVNLTISFGWLYCCTIKPEHQAVQTPDSSLQFAKTGCIPDKNEGSARRSNLMKSFQRLTQSEKKSVAFAVIPGGQVASGQLTELKTSPEEPKVIDNLCNSLRSADQGDGTTCVGRVTKEENNYDFYALSRLAFQDTDATSLHDLLSQNQGLSTNPSHRLTRKLRLQLAATFASTALQLHTTPWLDSSWNGHKIKFHQGILGHPYISNKFTKNLQPAPTEAAPGPTMGPIRNQTLFALGILLLELSTGKPLDSFKDAQNPHPFEDYIIASQLLKTLSEEESANYFEAAQACIFCNFRGSAKDLDLANDSFRQTFYEDVVVPLEEDLKYYCQARS
ncbi:MAG: hypothetical protein Q9169_004357 [Polycauliona sp. 2 TL-2023]